MTTTPPLPAPRTLLTSLIDTLASAPLAPPDPALTNPLGRLPAPHRALLATLHALYPSVLLPALDVLDRRLVTRVFVDGGGGGGGAGAPTATVSAAVERGGGVGAGVDASAGPGASGNVTVSGVGASEATGTMPERRQVAPEADPVPSSRSLAVPDAEAAEAGAGAGQDGGGVDGRGEDKHSPPNRQRLGSEPTFHIVRSAQPSQPFRRQHGHHQFNPNARQRTYVVRLRAWSCTCAAFAFASYPFEAPPSQNADPGPARQRGRVAGVDRCYAIEPASSSSGSGPGSAARDPGDSGRDGDGPEWEFGGLGIDGRGDDDEGGAAAAGMGTATAAGVPACKHLLACVLGERLAGLGLGEYMDERRAGREEGAGLVGEA
ncbi:hypothetical protein DL766_010602 [Monosporascus sp. MC13-8B]|nr:hypothetical protein DL763_005121 [Monosporascus cannonballus]RYP01961.1 hypothetical protein DL766_010602 [Monosporascus sp. MC13-8B]